MWVPNLLVREFLAIDALATSAILIGGITTLGHEAFYYSVEKVAFVGHARICAHVISCAESSEILSGFWGLFREQFKNNSSLFLLFFIRISNFNIKESLCIFL